MLDLHTHIWEHKPGTPVPTYEQLAWYCERARKRGVDQIAVTEHSHRFVRVAEEVMPHWERPASGPLREKSDDVARKEGGGDLDAYVDALVDAKRRGLPLLVGIEVDHFPGATQAMSSILDEYPFDIRLGSVHWLDAWMFDDYGTPVFANEWNHRDVSAVWRSYIDQIIDLAHTGMVDVLAHLDVIKVGGHRPDDLAEHEERLADALAGTSVAIEISSKGLRKPAEEIYPSPALLQRLVAHGMTFTTASDAHVPEQLGQDFDDLRRVLDTCGITELVSFDQRQRVPHPLP